MPAPLEDIGWLTRSANRVQLLELLANQPYTRPELTEEIGVTRVTVNRMIEAFEERGWIEVPVRDPEITPCGRLVLDHLEPFREAATTAHCATSRGTCRSKRSTSTSGDWPTRTSPIPHSTTYSVH